MTRLATMPADHLDTRALARRLAGQVDAALDGIEPGLALAASGRDLAEARAAAARQVTEARSIAEAERAADTYRAWQARAVAGGRGLR